MTDPDLPSETTSPHAHESAPPEAEPFLVFGAPVIEQAEIDEVVATLKSGWIGTGPKVARFENDFATYKGADNAVAVSSCTAALHLSINAAGIGPGDEVITTPLTFAATVNSIIHAGATPVLADIDPETMNIDAKQVAAAITPNTKAILPVHFAGRPCEMDELGKLADDHDLIMIEDCAHAVETSYHGQPAGTFGRFGCFSFYVTKNVITAEGGLVLARDDEDAARIKTLALHGMSRDAWKRFSDSGYKHYQVVDSGYKYNMTDIQAAIGIHQLARVEQNWIKRQAVWDVYQEAFADLPVGRPSAVAPNTRHSYHLYTLLIEEAEAGITRDEFLEEMTARGIGVGVHYLSLPEHAFYQETFGWTPDAFPHAARVGRATVSLPLSPGLSEHDVERVVAAVRELVT